MFSRITGMEESSSLKLVINFLLDDKGDNNDPLKLPLESGFSLLETASTLVPTARCRISDSGVGGMTSSSCVEQLLFNSHSRLFLLNFAFGVTGIISSSSKCELMSCSSTEPTRLDDNPIEGGFSFIVVKLFSLDFPKGIFFCKTLKLTSSYH